jgi:hypothetical protein
VWSLVPVCALADIIQPPVPAGQATAAC